MSWRGCIPLSLSEKAYVGVLGSVPYALLLGTEATARILMTLTFLFFSDFNCCIYLTRWAALQLAKLSLQWAVAKQVLGLTVNIPPRD